jgi:hypothetical protein
MKSYIVLSPDGIPLTRELFSTKKEAKEYAKQWAKRYADQGYYSTYRFGFREEIPAKSLASQCEIKEKEEDK